MLRQKYIAKQMNVCRGIVAVGESKSAASTLFLISRQAKFLGLGKLIPETV